jgi:hypothetical protein
MFGMTFCFEHHRLRDAEHIAWVAWRRVKANMSNNPSSERIEELSELAVIAYSASAKVGQHVEECMQCSSFLRNRNGGGLRLAG